MAEICRYSIGYCEKNSAKKTHPLFLENGKCKLEGQKPASYTFRKNIRLNGEGWLTGNIWFTSRRAGFEAVCTGGRARLKLNDQGRIKIKEIK